MEKNSEWVDKTVEMIAFVFPHLIDIATKHGPDFQFEQSGGDPDGNCLLMCFRTPARILTAAGEERASAGDCIIHTPGFPLWHAAVAEYPGGFCNDWTYVAAAVMLPLLEELAVSGNTLLSTGRPELLADSLRRIREEMAREDAFSARIIRDTLFRMLADIRRETDEYRNFRNSMTDAERRHYTELTRIRERVLAAPERDYTVRRLAAMANLSPERFAVLYRKFFHNSPLAEILDARLVTARRLLKTTAFQVKEVAARCGWHDEHYFARIFREKTGMTPGDFRCSRPNSGR